MLGFFLIILILIQFITGVFALTRLNKNIISVELVSLFHRIIPVLLVGVILAHTLRAIFFTKTVYSLSMSFKSGIFILILFFITLSSGYLIASGGEAAYWGIIISISSVLQFIVKIINSLYTILSGIGILAPLNINSIINSFFISSTSINNEIILKTVVFVHIIFSLVLIFLIYKHIENVHGNSTTSSYGVIESIKIGLLSTIESKDLRFFLIFLTYFAPLLVINTWITRTGNNINLQNEIKPPAKVITEFYLSGIYTAFRQFPILMAIFVFFIAIFIIVKIVFGKQKLLKILGLIFALSIFIYVSFSGFFTVEIDKNFEDALETTTPYTSEELVLLFDEECPLCLLFPEIVANIPQEVESAWQAESDLRVKAQIAEWEAQGFIPKSPELATTQNIQLNNTVEELSPEEEVDLY